MKKSFTDIYMRNVEGAAGVGLELLLTEGPILGGILLIGYLALFPLIATLIVGIKTLIDFFSRIEIAPEIITHVTNEIDTMDNKALYPLIETIVENHKKANSVSSKQLVLEFQTIAQKGAHVLAKYTASKRREMQEAHLGIDKNRDIKFMYRERDIANVTLKKEDEQAFQASCLEKRAAIKKENCVKYRELIKNYFVADHNTGKKTQHVICNFFHPAIPLSETSKEEEGVQVEVTAGS